MPRKGSKDRDSLTPDFPGGGGLDPEDEMDEEEENPGFSSAIDEVIYSLSVEGINEEIGEAEDFGWHGLLKNVTAEEIEDAAKALEIELDDDDRELIEKSAGMIVSEDPQGLIRVTYYPTEKKLGEDWAELQAQAEEFYGDIDAVE